MLDELPQAEATRQAFVAMVKQLAKVFPELDETKAVIVDQLASDLELPIVRLAPAVAFARGEPWWSGTSPASAAGPWTIRANSVILDFAKIGTWADYIAVRAQLVPAPTSPITTEDPQTAPIAVVDGPKPGKRPKSYEERWRVEGEVGQGGQAQVFKVTDRADTSGRVYALKRIKNPNRRERFQKEIEALKRLSHPGIPEIVDHSTPEDGLLWLVMPFAEDGSLEERRLLYKGNIDITMSTALAPARAALQPRP